MLLFFKARKFEEVPTIRLKGLTAYLILVAKFLILFFPVFLVYIIESLTQDHKFFIPVYSVQNEKRTKKSETTEHCLANMALDKNRNIYICISNSLTIILLFGTKKLNQMDPWIQYDNRQQGHPATGMSKSKLKSKIET